MAAGNGATITAAVAPPAPTAVSPVTSPRSVTASAPIADSAPTSSTVVAGDSTVGTLLLPPSCEGPPCADTFTVEP